MLVIASDIHLVDGTCAKSISPSAFYLFAEQLRELAYQASWRKDSTYRPVEAIDLVLLGDVFDPLHSTHWLADGPAGAVRPWTDPRQPQFPAMDVRLVMQQIEDSKGLIIDAMEQLKKPL